MPGWKEKTQLFDWIDRLIAEGDEHQTFFFGVGDHGGGIYERQLEWLLEAAETRDIEFSTLAHYFDTIEKTELPVYEGELTHHSPGCYSAVSMVKRQFAAVERSLFKAEKLVLESPGPDAEADTAKLDDAWNQFLFNYFHDVYPGTAVRKSFEGEVRDLAGYAQWTATSILEKRLERYAAQSKSDFLTEGGILLWNPLPVPVRAVFGFDTFADPNCNGKRFDTLRDENGNTVPLQWIRSAAAFGPNNAWGRAAAVVDLPPSGLRVFAYGYGDRQPDAVGFERQKAAFRRISFPVVADVGDTWGHGLAGSAKPKARRSSSASRRSTTVQRSAVCGPATAGSSRLSSSTSSPMPEFRSSSRAGARSGAKRTTRSNSTGKPASPRAPSFRDRPRPCLSARRTNASSRSSILRRRWMKTAAAPAFSPRRCTGTIRSAARELRLTLLRPVCYAEHRPFPPHGDEGYADLGEVEQEFWIADGRPAAELPAAARGRLWGAEHMEITAAADGAAFRRPVWTVEPPEVIALCQNRREFRLWNASQEEKPFRLLCDDAELASGALAPEEVRSIALK